MDFYSDPIRRDPDTKTLAAKINKIAMAKLKKRQVLVHSIAWSVAAFPSGGM